MASSNALFLGVLFLLVGVARASIEGGHCSDISSYDFITFDKEEAECCATDNTLRCEDKEEEVCIDVKEMVCDLNAYVDCQIKEERAEGEGGCVGGYKNFDLQDCYEEEFKEAHIKQVPVCKNVTKNNCVTDWQVDDNGNKVWTGLENCTPVTWEECTIEDKEVDFPTVRTECGIASQIKYFDYNPEEGGAKKISTNCVPKGSVSCRPVTRTDCILVTYTDCKIGGDVEDGCKKQEKFVPSQEKIHQKKCLNE